MIYVFAFVVVVGVLLRRRAVRKRTLAGLDGGRPVFSIEPPARRMGSRRTEAL